MKKCFAFLASKTGQLFCFWLCCKKLENSSKIKKTNKMHFQKSHGNKYFCNKPAKFNNRHQKPLWTISDIYCSDHFQQQKSDITMKSVQFYVNVTTISKQCHCLCCPEQYLARVKMKLTQLLTMKPQMNVSSMDIGSQEQTLSLYGIPLKCPSMNESSKDLEKAFLYLRFLKFTKYNKGIKGEGNNYW